MDNDSSILIVNGLLLSGIVIALVLFVMVGRMNKRLRKELDRMQAALAQEEKNEEAMGAPRD